MDDKARIGKLIKELQGDFAEVSVAFVKLNTNGNLEILMPLVAGAAISYGIAVINGMAEHMKRSNVISMVNDAKALFHKEMDEILENIKNDKDEDDGA